MAKSRKVSNVQRRIHEKLTTTSGFKTGRIRPEEYGAQIGWWSFYKFGKPKKKRVINLGPVMLGTQTYLLGAAVGESSVFLGLNGKLWKVSGKKSKLDFNIVAPKTTDAHALKAWADTVAQRIVDKLSPRVEVQVNREGNLRYKSMVKTLVSNRVEEGVALGYTQSFGDYARAINHRWTVSDLLTPRYPTIKHALHVSLVLALPAKQAAQLIAGAALYEHKSPYITEDIALSMYQQAVSLLSRLCPEWWNNGAYTRWEFVGSIDMLFTKQYTNTLVHAKNLDVSLQTASGMIQSEPLGALLRQRRSIEE